MGYHVNKPVSFKHPKFIDYAITHRQDFMDIYLMAKCRFVLGTTSGICDIAMIFDRPRIGVNWVPIGHVPWGKNSLYIPKKVKYRKTEEYVSFSKLIRESKNRFSEFLWNGHMFQEKGYIYEGNSPSEILDVTKEMIKRLNGEFNKTNEDRLLQKYYQLFPSDHWSFQVKTPIGLEFLKKHQHLFFDHV